MYNFQEIDNATSGQLIDSFHDEGYKWSTTRRASGTPPLQCGGFGAVCLQHRTPQALDAHQLQAPLLRRPCLQHPHAHILG